MMFTAIIDTETIASYVDHLEPIADEAIIHLNQRNLHTRVVDPANVSMCSETLSADAFESYEADGGHIGVDLSRLSDIIGFANADDLIQFELNEETRKLDIQVGGLEYTLALIDPDSIRAEPDIPNLEHDATITVAGSDLDRAVTAGEMVSDRIALGARNGDAQSLYASAEGDTDDMQLDIDEADLVDAEIDADCESLFSLDYLDDLNKVLKKHDEVRIELGTEIPMMTHTNYADGQGATQYLLAPRIQSDDV